MGVIDSKAEVIVMYEKFVRSNTYYPKKFMCFRYLSCKESVVMIGKCETSEAIDMLEQIKMKKLQQDEEILEPKRATIV